VRWEGELARRHVIVGQFEAVEAAGRDQLTSFLVDGQSVGLLVMVPTD
jgi:hypothetical protein